MLVNITDKAIRNYRTYLSLVKLQPWFLSLQFKTYLWTELQHWFLRLQWKSCPWTKHSDDDDDDDYRYISNMQINCFLRNGRYLTVYIH